MPSPLGMLGRAVVVLAIAVAGLYAFILLARRVGIESETPFEAMTWHGRPVSQEDHDPRGPRFGFVLYMLVIFTLIFVGVTVADLLFG